MLFHFHDSALQPAWRAGLPQAVNAALRHGFLGVQVFFVLSGYVIARSLRGPVGPRSAAAFVARRQLRLAPAYYASIALVLADQALAIARRPGVAEALTGLLEPRRLAAHLLFLQDVLGLRSLQAVYWTLGVELQFYVGWVLVRWSVSTLSHRSSALRSAFAGPMLPLAAVATLYCAKGMAGGPSPWLTPHAYLFALGLLAAHVRERWAAVALAVLTLGAAGLAVAEGRPEPVAGLLTAGVLTLGTWRQAWLWGLSSAPLVGLGRISYSLYLVHSPLGFRILNAASTLTGQQLGPALAWAALALTVSLLGALTLYRWVEQPSLRWAARVR